MEYTLQSHPVGSKAPVDPTNKICSWNVDSQEGWINAIAAHRLFPDYAFMWNELMMATVGDGYDLKDYIPAIFYDAARESSGLEPARSFQRKAYQEGNNIPIVRLDFNAPPDHRFSFRAQDQVIDQR